MNKIISLIILKLSLISFVFSQESYSWKMAYTEAIRHDGITNYFEVKINLDNNSNTDSILTIYEGMLLTVKDIIFKHDSIQPMPICGLSANQPFLTKNDVSKHSSPFGWDILIPHNSKGIQINLICRCSRLKFAGIPKGTEMKFSSLALDTSHCESQLALWEFNENTDGLYIPRLFSICKKTKCNELLSDIINDLRKELGSWDTMPKPPSDRFTSDCKLKKPNSQIDIDMLREGGVKVILKLNVDNDSIVNCVITVSIDKNNVGYKPLWARINKYSTKIDGLNKIAINCHNQEKGHQQHVFYWDKNEKDLYGRNCGCY